MKQFGKLTIKENNGLYEICIDYNALTTYKAFTKDEKEYIVKNFNGEARKWAQKYGPVQVGNYFIMSPLNYYSIIFKTKEDAQKTLEWIESLIILQKLSGE